MIADFPFLICRVRRPVFLILFAILLLGATASRVVASQSIELTWSPSATPNVVAYKVYFGTQSGHYLDSSTFGLVSDVTIPGLANGVTYYFAVTAIDDLGNESPFSGEATYAIPAAATLNLQVQGTTAAMQAVDATWTPSTATDVFGYAVKYGTTSGVYTNDATFYGTTEGIISALVPGATYYFSVSPIDAYGIEPAGSPEVAYTVPPVVPVVLLAHVPAGSSGVELTWNAIPNDGVVGYNLRYGTASHAYSSYVNCGNLNDFVLHGLTAGQRYYFAVSAVDAYGNESQLSTEANCVAVAPIPLVAKVKGSTEAVAAANVSWTASPDVDVYGYVVYYGTQTNYIENSQYVFGNTNGLITGLVGGTNYYFAVAPIDSFGVEPVASSQVAYAVPAPPSLILNGHALTNASQAELSWNLITNQGIVNYIVYYGSQSGSYESATGFGVVNDAVVPQLVGNHTYYFAVAGQDAYGNQTKLSNEAVITTPPPSRMLLQMQTYTDGNGQANLLEIHTQSPVTGPWELDCSIDMKNWTYYTSGYGYGYGEGYDVDAWINVDPTAPQMFFRVVNN